MYLSLSAGEHWVLISSMRDGSCDFLCSQKSDPKDLPHVWKRIKETNRALYEFPYAVQNSELSTACGAYCLFFAYCISRSFSPPEILHYFFSPASFHDSLTLSPSSSSTFSPPTARALRRGYEFDLRIGYTIRHLFPFLRHSKFTSENLLIDVEFLREQKERQNEWWHLPPKHCLPRSSWNTW